MHVRTSFQNFLSLIFGPNHKSIHRSFDMLSPVSFSLGLPDDLGAVTFGVLVLLRHLLVLLLLLLQRPELAGRDGAHAGQGGEGRLAQAGRLEPGRVLEELQVGELGEGRAGEAREEAGVARQAASEPKRLMEDRVVSL